VTVVADTSVLVGAIDRHDDDHDRCAGALRRRLAVGVVVTAAVAVEVDYLVSTRVGRAAARAFLRDLDTGAYVFEPVDAGMLRRAVELDGRFADVGLGLAEGTGRRRSSASTTTTDWSHRTSPSNRHDPSPDE
jgi:predicted nucleic acid-binding protein